MAKVTNLQTTKSETGSTQGATETISQIAEIVFAFRNVKPTLGECARVSDRAAQLLKLEKDEKESVANAAAVAIARKYNLVS